MLVADDYFETSDVLSAAISASTVCKTVTAYNVKKAVEMTLACRPQIAILDIDMPVLDGVEAARRIRAATGQECPVMIAYSSGMYAERGRQSGLFDLLLIKPIDFERLFKVIDEC